MSQANVDVLRRLFDSHKRRHYAEAAKGLAPDVVYEVGQELPAHGREAVRAMWERWDNIWDELETVPEEFIDAGHQVLVTIHYSARGRGSGIKSKSASSTSTPSAMASVSTNASSASDPRPSKQRVSTRR
jgi:ketosteroid isomerase-like protein